MPKRSSNPPSDPNQAAFRAIQIATESDPPEPAPVPPDEAPKKNPAAVSLGRLGGLKGGPARAASLSAKKRRLIAVQAAEARWKKKT